MRLAPTSLVVSVLICLLHQCLLDEAHANQPAPERESQPAPFIPSDAVAYYRLDTAALGASSAASFLPLALQLAETYGLVDPEFHPLFDGVLAGSIAGSVPHTLCILDLDVEYDEAAERGFRMVDFKAVLVLESPADHRTYLQALATILDHYDAGSTPDHQTQFELSTGRAAGRFKPGAWAPWQTVEWTSLSDSFVVGLGEGALERWVSAQSERPSQTFLNRHRRAVSSSSSNANAATRFLEVWINFDRIHETMPDIIAQGRPRRMITSWKLDNARNWMFHASRAGRYLLADITWQRRSDSSDIVAHRALTIDHWPSDLTLREPPGDFIAVFKADFAGMYDRLLTAHRATISPRKLEAYDKSMRQHHARHRRAYESLFPSFKPYLIISDHPSPPVPIPGALNVYFELQPDASAKRTQAQMESVLEHYLSAAEPERLGDAAVRLDRETRTHYLLLEKTGRLKFPAWGWVGGRYLVGGWSPNAVVENRERVEREIGR